jgi:hypothetical protein
MSFYIQAKATKSIDAAIGEYFPGSDDRLGELYQATLVKGNRYEYLAGDACGCGCGGEAVMIAYTEDIAPIAIWLCGSLFNPA